MSLPEIRSLVVRYPYCANFRILLALKSKQEDFRDKEKYERTAAIYTIDRGKLYDLMNDSALHIERMQLPDLKEHEELIALKELNETHTHNNHSPQQSFIHAIPDTGQLTDLPEFISEDKADEEFVPNQHTDDNQTTQENYFEQILFHIVDQDAVVMSVFSDLFGWKYKPVEKTSVKNDATDGKSTISYDAWLKQFLAPQSYTNSHIHIETKEENTEEHMIPHDLSLEEQAKESIAENHDIATETWAEILVKQKQYKEAIKIYERLCLQFPEKNTTFAQKIENLKKLL